MMNADFFGVVFFKSLQKSLHSAFVPLHIFEKNLCNSHILEQKRNSKSAIYVTFYQDCVTLPPSNNVNFVERFQANKRFE